MKYTHLKRKISENSSISKCSMSIMCTLWNRCTRWASNRSQHSILPCKPFSFQSTCSTIKFAAKTSKSLPRAVFSPDLRKGSKSEPKVRTKKVLNWEGSIRWAKQKGMTLWVSILESSHHWHWTLRYGGIFTDICPQMNAFYFMKSSYNSSCIMEIILNHRITNSWYPLWSSSLYHTADIRTMIKSDPISFSASHSYF